MIKASPTILGGGVGCLALTVVLAWQVVAPITLDLPELAPKTPEKLKATIIELVSASVPQRDAFAEVDQRPLFVLGRRPPPPPAAALTAQAQTQSLDRYNVLGIIAAPNRATALLRGPSGDMVHLQVGQALEGWTLKSITPNKLIFDLAGKSQEIQFKGQAPRPGQNAQKISTGTQR